MVQGKTQPRILRGEERNRFLGAFNRRYRTPHRDWLACRLMLEAGLRVGEVVALKVDHFDPRDCRLVVRDGKGGKDRELGVGYDLCQALDKWLPRRGEEYPECPWLFPTSNGGQVYPQHLRRTVSRAAERADLREAEKVSPHTLRHTFAVWLRENGASLEEVQRALGHEELATTERYLARLDIQPVKVMKRIANDEVGAFKLDDVQADSRSTTDAEAEQLQEELRFLQKKMERVEAQLAARE